MDHRSWGRRVLLGFCLGMLILLLLVDGFTTKTVGAAGTGLAERPGSSLAGSAPVLVSNGRGGLVLPSAGRPAGASRSPSTTAPTRPGHRRSRRSCCRARAGDVLRGRQPGGALPQRDADAPSRRLRARQPHLHARRSLAAARLGGAASDLAHRKRDQPASPGQGHGSCARPTPRPPKRSRRPRSAPGEPMAATGHIIAVANYDTQDWERPGVSTIVSNVLSEPAIKHGIGGIVLMHDAGGNRSQTVAALPKLIAALRARGFRFATVSQMAGLSRSQVEVPASAGQRLRGSVFDAMLALAGFVTILVDPRGDARHDPRGLRMVAALALARVQLRRVRDLPLDPSFAPAVSILVPAHNEAVGIERAVRSLAGSTLRGRARGDRGGRRLDRRHRGDRRRARRAGSPLVRRRPSPALRQANARQGRRAEPRACGQQPRHSRDGRRRHRVRARDARRARPALSRAHASGAISGNTKVGNRRGLIGHWQHIEYVMGFNLDRRMYEVLGSTPTVPGAIGAFRREALAEIGGVSGATLAEDTDITLDVGRAGWRVLYENRARAWTEAPSTLRGLFRQRSRWAYGTIQSMWKHRRALTFAGDGSSGRAGRGGDPHLPGAAAARRATDRPVRDLQHRVPRPDADPRLLGRLQRVPARARLGGVRLRRRVAGVPCGRCRCSRSDTARSPIWWSTTRSSRRCSAAGWVGATPSAPAR